jgi:hypothetical protein
MKRYSFIVVIIFRIEFKLKGGNNIEY